MNLFPFFQDLTGRHIVLVGGGHVAREKLEKLLMFTENISVIAEDTSVVDAFLRERGSTAVRVRNKTFEDFDRDYQVPRSLLDEIFAEGDKQEVKRPDDADEIRRTEEGVSLQLKALIARDLWTMTEYFRVVNAHSDIVNCALEQLK